LTIAIDRGGGIETARPIPRLDPTYVDEVALHYCVANIPAEVASTSIVALSSVSLPYFVKISDEGAEVAAADSNLAKGLSTLGGNLISELVAEAHGFSSPRVPRGVRQ
jgi:alanine dehydrogenase